MDAKYDSPRDNIMKINLAHNGKEFFKCERQTVPEPKAIKYCHFHDSYEIYYLYSGERYYFVQDKSYHIKSGSLVFIKPYYVHYTTNCSDFGYDRHLVSFNENFIKHILQLSENEDLLQCFDNDICVLNLNMHDRYYVESVLKAMEYEEKTNMADDSLMKKMLLAQLLVFANRNFEKLKYKGTEYLSFSHKTVSLVTAYINKNYMDEIALYDIAKKFHVNSNHLSRIFKKYIGFSFTEYVNGIRVKEAQTLLRETNLKVQDISDKVGFNSSTQFGRSFKKISGISPNTYRKMNKNTTD